MLTTVPDSSCRVNLAITDFKVEPQLLNIGELFNARDEHEFKDPVRLSILIQSLSTFSKIVTLNETSAVVELMAPTIALLKAISHISMHGSARQKLDAIATTLMEHRQKCRSRTALTLQTRKQIAIRSFAPKFQTNFAPDKHYDHDHERSQAQKVAREYKQEFKGAVRELRKDAVYLNKIRLQNKKSSDAAYKRKIDGIMGNLAAQEGAMRGYERENKKSKKRK
jgi:nucleolar protein 14